MGLAFAVATVALVYYLRHLNASSADGASLLLASSTGRSRMICCILGGSETASPNHLADWVWVARMIWKERTGATDKVPDGLSVII